MSRHDRPALRIGIAGCGMIAGAPLRDGRPLETNHAASARNIDGVELVAVADPSASRRAVFQDFWRVPRAYETVERMLTDEPLDVLVVATPAETHLEVGLAALQAGVRGILCEKPLTGELASAKRLVEACARANVPLAANFMRRWDTSHERAVSAIRDGAIGELRTIQGSYTGTLRGNGSHMLDLVRMILGDTDASIVTHWVSRLGHGSTDGAVSALLEHDGCRIFVNPIEQADYFVFELTVIGTSGRIRFLSSGNDIRVDAPKPSDKYPTYRFLEEVEPLPRDTLVEAFRRALEGVVLAVRDGTSLSVSGAAHVGTLALIEQLVECATRAENQAS